MSYISVYITTFQGETWNHLHLRPPWRLKREPSHAFEFSPVPAASMQLLFGSRSNASIFLSQATQKHLGIRHKITRMKQPWK